MPSDAAYAEAYLAERLRDPEFREAYERSRREIAIVDELLSRLEALRDDRGMTKAGLARAIGKNPAVIRRLLTASGNPELKTFVALANALDADVVLVPRDKSTTGEHQQTAA
ncbi:MAG: helix-turn-helix transcriptional regulator [Thermoleophilia bacterium]